MPKYYLFRTTTGTDIALTDDQTGAKLPQHHSWLYFDEVDLSNDDTMTIVGKAAEIIACIERDGYYHWPPNERLPRR
ncbi:MAG: hypothetical protein H0V72_28635 [Bradyrhizobium sp.]|nr:hypothetical protein [Bradyrhizobium sp.]